MSFRLFPLLAGLVTALGATACSDDGNDATGGAARGGSGGSTVAGEGGGGSSQAGATGAQTPKAGLQLSLHSPDPAIPNTECFPEGMSALGNPPPTVDPLDRGETVSHGDSELYVVCSVTGPDTFSVEATIDGDDLRFKVTDGTLDAATGKGTFELLVDTVEAGNIVTEVEQLCTFDVSESPLGVSEGNLFATFECPVLWNHATATDTACGATGVLVLESCAN